MSDYRTETASSQTDARAGFTHRLGAFASATLISRILGYVRDALVAYFFGGGLQTDAFYTAFKIPNLLRRFLGEGSLTAAFVPVFSDVLAKEGKEEAKRLFNSLATGLTLLLVGLVLLGIVFAVPITKVVAWGFTRDPEKFRLTAELVRLTFPFLLVVSLAALVSAVLNSLGRFFTPAVAPSGLSIGEIGFLLIFAQFFDSPVHGLAISAVVGGLIHLVWQFPALAREGYMFRPVKPLAHPKVKRVLLLMVPTIIGLCADQVNSFVDQFCASFLRDGSVTALYNSNRIMQLPLALFGVAVSSVALPALSQSASRGNKAEFKNLLGFSLRIANFVLIPSLIGLIVLGLPIIQVLFEHGRFTEEYSRLTYLALFPYALGLPAYSAIRILASAFYAQQNTRTPVRVALWAMGLHIVANWLLMMKWEVAGLALSTAISAWFQAVCLFFLLRKKLGVLGGRQILKSFLFGTLAGLGMGTLCAGLVFWGMEAFSLVFRLSAAIAGGMVFYFLLAKFLKIEEYYFFINALLRRRFN